jgi:hypothetical protein
VRRFLLKLISLVAIASALSGAVVVGLTLAGVYMVLFEGMRPGEPIWMDVLAPSLRDACQEIACGIAVIGLALFVRGLIRGK